MSSSPRRFEKLLFQSRYIVLVAVVASLVSALVLFCVASIDVVYVLKRLPGYADFGMVSSFREALRAEILTYVIKAIDGYLLATVMMVNAFGLYELFIDRISFLEETEFASRVLLIRSLDDLKDRLFRVIMLILAVKFLQIALEQRYQGLQDVFYMAFGVLFISAAMYLAHGSGHRNGAHNGNDDAH